MEDIESLEEGTMFYIREDLLTEHAGQTFEATVYDPNDGWYSGFVSTGQSWLDCSSYQSDELVPANDAAKRHFLSIGKEVSE